MSLYTEWGKEAGVFISGSLVVELGPQTSSDIIPQQLHQICPFITELQGVTRPGAWDSQNQ